jgi:hypothetical protein
VPKKSPIQKQLHYKPKKFIGALKHNHDYMHALRTLMSIALKNI